MKYKLFFSDFDGTLGWAPDFIEEETIKTIRKYQQNGGKFVICTGRSYHSIKKVCEKYGLSGLVICFQGALIMDLDTNQAIFDEGLNRELCCEAVNDLLKEKVDVGVYVDNLYYYQERGEGIREYERLCACDGVKVDNLIDFIKNSKENIRKVLSILDPEKKKILMERLNKKFGGSLVANSSAENFLEVINPSLSKGEAIRKVAKYFNIPLSEVIAVGDSLNDLELIKGEWHGVVVGDGMEEVKPYAKEITVEFKNQPVKVLLEKYCLD